ncbi:MAG: hypothetical protein ACREA0_15865, partial [bacterium]
MGVEVLRAGVKGVSPLRCGRRLRPVDHRLAGARSGLFAARPPSFTVVFAAAELGDFGQRWRRVRPD